RTAGFLTSREGGLQPVRRIEHIGMKKAAPGAAFAIAGIQRGQANSSASSMKLWPSSMLVSETFTTAICTAAPAPLPSAS
ncbi:hypothetical protein LLG90_28100, partial [Aromatoleum toluclasticum]|uniref:hypothetical protein n=1 Tax=Aromatoleum toluclasticum TaxID=92003 RepID=UPI001D18C8B6